MPQTAAATQRFVEIKEIRDSVVYLKNGTLLKLLIVSGVNFDLKSEMEQEVILNSFQNFLNTLDFSVQFFIHSRKVNVDEYLNRMRERQDAEPNELLKIQIGEYIDFIRTFVAENAIISKTFFVSIPYQPVALTNQAKGIFSIFSKGPSAEASATTSRGNLDQLTHRVNQVTQGLEQIGLRVAILGDDELIELFYNLYNPQLTEKRGLEIAKGA